MIKILPFYLLLSLCTSFTLWGCSDDNEEEIAGELITIDESYLSVSAEAEETTASIKFTARSGWTASVKETEAQDWLTLSATEGIGGAITLDLTLAINDNEATRTATIILTCGNTQKEITVTQSGSDLQIMDESDGRIGDRRLREILQARRVRLDGHAAQRRAMVVVPLEAERTLLRVLGSGLWRRPQCRNRSGEHAGGHR